jgi:hypothetical protein
LALSLLAAYATTLAAPSKGGQARRIKRPRDIERAFVTDITVSQADRRHHAREEMRMRIMKSRAVKSLAVVAALLTAMTWAKARSTANVVEGNQYVATSAGGGGGLDLPTRTPPLW